MTDMNVMIVGGGTGGHISPGIALYEEFAEKKINAYFLTGKRDKRFSMLKDIPDENIFYYGAPPFTRNVFKLPLFIIRFLTAMLSARKIMKKMKIKAVIGMGGYASAPALAAAKLNKRAIFLCEQNSIPGMVTKLFAKYSNKIYGAFEVSSEYLKDKKKFFLAGNPIRKDVLVRVGVQEAKKAFHLGHCSRIVLVLGGSQGALKINELVFGLKKEYPGDFENVGFIWSTGEYSYNRFKEKIHNEIGGGSIYLSPYIKRVGLAYLASDIAISRAGAGVMMELAAAGIPSILIPYPFSAMNHQDKNAEVFEKKGAAVKISSSDAVPGNVAPLLIKLLKNERLLKKMSDNSAALSRRNASELIVRDVMEEMNCSEIQKKCTS